MTKGKVALSILLLTFLAANLVAQVKRKAVVKAENGALQSIPSVNRKSLVERLDLYIGYLQSTDAANLFDLVTERKKKGLTRAEFVNLARVSTEGQILHFRIRRVSIARENDYRDEPRPGPDEGDKWFVSGCAKVKDDDGRIVRYAMGFDMWLTGGQWYISRGGRRLDDGFIECKL